MKKRIALIISGVLLVAIGGFWYFYSTRQEASSTAWSYVPENAIVVYESSNLFANWQRLTQSPLWNILGALPETQQLSDQIAYLDSLPSIRTLLQKKPLLVAIQVVGDDALDATFFCQLSGEADNKALQKALTQLKNEANLRTEERKYDGFTIYELSDGKDKAFSYVLHEGVFAGSFTSFLVEDVVRTMADEQASGSFVAHNQALLDLPKLANDEGNLYLNARRLAPLLSVFTESGEEAQVGTLDALCRAMLLDVSIQDQQLLLNGFSEAAPPADVSPEAADEAQDLYLQTFADQEPQSLGIGDFVPNRTAWLYYLGFSDAPRWQKSRAAYQQSQSLPVYRKLTKQQQTFESKYQVALSDWYQWFGNEAALLTLESINTEHPDHALLIEVKDTAAAAQALGSLATLLTQAENIELYQEKFSDYTIGELTYAEFPTLLLGPIAKGYEQCFYLLTDQYLVMANNVRTLKRLILDKESENTWSKSLKQSRFLESTLDESNLSLIVDVAHSWSLLLPQLAPKWQKMATEHASQLKQAEKVAIQFSGDDEAFYTSIAVNYPETPEESLASASFTTVSKVFTDQPIRTKPYIVRNHDTQALEVLFQDEDNVLQLVSDNQQTLWKDSLGVPMIGDFYQIDFYNSNKLQYLFASDSAIHVVDRNGSPVEGYPLYMPAGVHIQHLSLIDYDNSKKYRFLVSDQNGGLWMFNTDRENLEGWNPNGIASIPATPPFHVRVRDKDYLIAIGGDGTIYVKNRRGDDYPGFPLRLNRDCHSPAFVMPASTLEETTLTTVTDEGELITFNLKGNITQRVQLYRPSSDARFTLCEDALGKTFVLVRQDQESLGVLDRQGVLLFEKDFFSPSALATGMLQAQYYDFGAGTEIYAITDQVQEFTYLFDPKGTLINNRPIESDYAVGLLYSEDRQTFRLYRNFENEFAVLSF